MPPQAWHALLVNGTPQLYDGGESLVRQGEPGRYVLALTSGMVKVSRVEADGHELILATRGRGEIIGDLTYIDSRERSATVTAISTCLAYIVTAERFKAIVARFELYDLLFRPVTSRLRESEDSRSELARLSARCRIARMLLRLSTDGCCALSQADLAMVTRPARRRSRRSGRAPAPAGRVTRSARCRARTPRQSAGPAP